MKLFLKASEPLIFSRSEIFPAPKTGNIWGSNTGQWGNGVELELLSGYFRIFPRTAPSSPAVPSAPVLQLGVGKLLCVPAPQPRYADKLGVLWHSEMPCLPSQRPWVTRRSITQHVPSLVCPFGGPPGQPGKLP